MRQTILKLTFALFIATTSICMSTFAEDSQEFSYGLKTDKMIVPMTEESRPSISASMPKSPFNPYTLHHATQVPFVGGFHGGFVFGMASTPMAFKQNHFSHGFGHF